MKSARGDSPGTIGLDPGPRVDASSDVRTVAASCQGAQRRPSSCVGPRTSQGSGRLEARAREGGGTDPVGRLADPQRAGFRPPTSAPRGWSTNQKSVVSGHEKRLCRVYRAKSITPTWSTRV